jgi:tetratricopeptide (TPR) repeat protein
MGTVLLARDRILGRSVAIKVLTPEISRALGPERFAREIRLTAQLVHPNIVPLFDSGESDGWLYYVMPFIDGPTLRARLNDARPVTVPEVIRIVADTAEALAYAHGMGVVHRDVKPENIFFYGGRALLADFGIATSEERGPDGGPLTATGTIIGTVAYMSPEQASGERDLDGRADLYSLGCVAYELLSGRPPYDRPSAIATLAAHLADDVPSVQRARPDVDPALATLVEQILAKKRDDRPRDAAAVLDALRPLETQSGSQRGPATGRRPVRPESRQEPAEVRDLVAKARELYQTTMQGGEGARDKLLMARVYAEKALALAPESAIVLTTMADIVHLLAVRGFAESLEEVKPRLRDLRLRALAADDSLGELHFALGTMFLYWEDDFEMAGTELALAVELAPESAEAHRIYGAWLRIAGRTHEALEQMRVATRLAPKAPFMHVGHADVLMALGRYDEAIGPLRQALRLLPRYDAALERLEMSCHRAGRHDEALDARRMLLGVRGAADRIAQVTGDAAEHGWLVARERDLRRELADLLARAEREDPFEDRSTTRQLADKILIVLAELGEWTQAMDWVERAYHRRPGRLRRVLNDLPYDHHGLARDPRYTRLLRSAGIEELLD